MNLDTYICLHKAVFSYKRLLKAKLDQIGYRDINPDQVVILFGLVDNGETSISDILYVGTNSSYSISKLSQMGYINYNSCLDDKRKIVISITPKGLDVVNSLDKLIDFKIDNQSAINSIKKFESSVLAELR